MASERDKARMKRIAETMEGLNREAVREAAGRTPGENVEIGLRLGNFALAAAQHPHTRTEEVPPARIWRELKKGRSAR